jgi:hypothetical protein
MTTPSNPIELFSPFLPSTYDVPNEQDRITSFLEDKLSQFADVINDKQIGVYTQSSPSFNGEKWAYLTTKKIRNGYQSICYIPSFVPQTITVNTTPQYPITDINPQFIVTKVWGSATKPCTAVNAGNGDYFSFMSQGDSRISFTMSDTQIVITTDGARAAYSGFIIIEFLRDGF